MPYAHDVGETSIVGVGADLNMRRTSKPQDS